MRYCTMPFVLQTWTEFASHLLYVLLVQEGATLCVLGFVYSNQLLAVGSKQLPTAISCRHVQLTTSQPDCLP
jgi:hypothetical protein